MIAPADAPRSSPHEPAVAPDGHPLRLALVNDYELVVAGLAAVLAPYGDRVQVVEFDVDDDESQPVDIAVYDTFAAPGGGSAEVGHLLDSAKVGKVVAYSFAEVIGLIAQGYSNEEIARLCYLSINTVKTYIRSAYRKAGVNTRAQAVAWALRHGFRPERMPSL